MGLSIGLLVYILLFEKKKKNLCDTPLLKGLHIDFYIKTLLYLISCMINKDLVYLLRLC